MMGHFVDRYVCSMRHGSHHFKPFMVMASSRLLTVFSSKRKRRRIGGALIKNGFLPVNRG